MNMNAQQRKAIGEIHAKVAELLSGLETLQSQIEDQASDEREKFDNMTEGLQAGERGQAIEASADKLESASSAVESAVSSLEEALEALDDATSGE
jgi:prefoldin subunit 5